MSMLVLVVHHMESAVVILCTVFPTTHNFKHTRENLEHNVPVPRGNLLRIVTTCNSPWLVQGWSWHGQSPLMGYTTLTTRFPYSKEGAVRRENGC